MINTNKIIVASTPRTGSMWTYNIIREIIKLYKYKLVPEIIPQSDNDMMDIQKKDYKNLNIISVIKVHQLVKIENLNNTKLIFNFRDPRDSLVSYLRFMKIDKYELINKINFIKNIIRRIEYYRITHQDVAFNPLSGRFGPSLQTSKGCAWTTNEVRETGCLSRWIFRLRDLW